MEEGFTHHRDRFPNVLMLVEILLVLPLSTVCCDPGFSIMRKIKSDWRSCLLVKILDCLMRIEVEGPSAMAFDPENALQFWRTGGARYR